MPQTIQSTFREPASAVARLLGQHYGDRSVYLQDASDRELLKDALSLGLVSTDGQLTIAGYSFWQRHQHG